VSESTDDVVASDLVASLQAGDRRALARAITIVESSRPDHRQVAEQILDLVLPSTGGATRVGISGPPGAGKSTFIESLGLEIVGRGHRVAVLAVDPSSARSGGSILGDKTRMVELGRHDAVFIRPTPSGGTLGGVARRTREALLLCEAAGFDVVLVETVGVGQSEVAVADLVDLFCVLVAPGGGDELQGIKRGIMELADLVVVNKADGDLAPAAGRIAADYEAALHLMRPKWSAWTARVLTCSALERRGIDTVWSTIEEFESALRATGELDGLRRRQAVAWMWSEVEETLRDRLEADPAVRARLEEVEPAVGKGSLSPATAASRVLEAFLGSTREASS
jgi:LAO/AO transport system kinase